MYGLAEGNGEKARYILPQRYSNRTLPDSRTFSNLHRLWKLELSEKEHLKKTLNGEKI